jgi:hypothetical protein
MFKRSWYNVQPGTLIGQNILQFQNHNRRSIYNGEQGLGSSSSRLVFSSVRNDSEREALVITSIRGFKKNLFLEQLVVRFLTTETRTTYGKRIIRLATFYSPDEILIGYFDLRVAVSRNSHWILSYTSSLTLCILPAPPSIYHLQLAGSNSLLVYCMIEWGYVNYMTLLGPS